MNRKAITRDTGTAKGQSEALLAAAATALAFPLLVFPLPAAAQASAGESASAAAPAGGGSSSGAAAAPATGWLGGLTLPSLRVSLPSLGGDRQIDPPVFLPGVRASGTLTDNVRHAGPGREDTDLIFEVSPYLIASSQRPGASYDIRYQLRNFFRVGDGEFNMLRHNLTANGSFALAGDRLWLDASAFMGSVATSITGPLSADQSTSFGNRSNFRSFSISPWYRDQLGSWATYTLRYGYTKSSGGSSLFLADDTHMVSGSIAGIDSGRDWNWQAYGSFQRQEYSLGRQRDLRSSGATLSYRVNHELMLRGGVVYDQIDGVRDENGDDYGWGPMLGFDWRPNSRLSLSAEVAERYYGTTGSARVAWNTARSTTGIQYARSVNTNSNAALLAIDPFALTAGLGQNSVLASLIAAGLWSPGLPITTMLTDNAMLTSQLTAFWALRGASRSLSLSAWWSKRENSYSVSMPGAGGGSSGPRGSSSPAASILDEINERGLSLTLQQRLDGRSVAEATIDRRIIEAPSLGTDTRLTTFRAGVSTTLDSKTTAFAGFRRAEQTATGAGTRYDENAIYGGIDMKFK